MLEVGQWLTDTRAPAEALDLGRIEPDAVRQPDPLVEPAEAFQIVERPAAETGAAPGVLVLGLGQMGVQPDPMARGQRGRIAHQALGHRERRAGRQRDLHHRPYARLVMAPDQPLAVGQDDLFGLHHLARRQPAVLARQAHRAAGQHDAQAERPRLLDLEVDRVLETGREHVVVVARRGGPRQQQLGQRRAHREPQMLGRQLRPDRIERLEPGEQRLVDRGRAGAGQRLVEVVVGVDQAR